MIDISLICIFVTFLFKIGCAPFHFWVPDVYEGAPLSSSIIISIIPKIAIFYTFIKINSSIHSFFIDLKETLLFFGLLSSIVGTFFALTQTRIKRLILYSSISQIGFLIIALGVNSLQSLTSLYFFLIVYLISSLIIWGHLSSFLNFQTRLNLFQSRLSSTILLSNFVNLFQFHP
jgi:NADH:ubiquinone oxidoreductase subunit 2 (subunit N)